MKLLNVGGGSRVLPPRYEGCEQTLLDIDSSVNPDVCLDAKEIGRLAPNAYDVVYCSHNLEHFYQHDVDTVLKGFLHVLKPGGFADISVPNLEQLFKDMQVKNLDLQDIWYRNGSGLPITFHDVIYGWSMAMSQGNLYYAHKCGFTASSFYKELESAGFTAIQIVLDSINITAKAYKPGD